MKDNIEKMELIKPADVTNHIETASIKELEEGIGIIDGSNHMFSELRTVSNNIDSNVENLTNKSEYKKVLTQEQKKEQKASQGRRKTPSLTLKNKLEKGK